MEIINKNKLLYTKNAPGILAYFKAFTGPGKNPEKRLKTALKTIASYTRNMVKLMHFLAISPRSKKWPICP
jgi:hypothetical protein